MRDENIRAELHRIADAHGGLLKAEDVVEAARPASSPLHSRFDWDDSSAAEQWRLEQARQLIRVTVHYVEGSKEVKTYFPDFYSLTPDRKLDGGGYRLLDVILSDKDMRAQLLADALAEMKSFQVRYSRLRELADVFDAMRTAESKVRRRQRKSA